MDRIILCNFATSPYLKMIFPDGSSPLSHIQSRVAGLQEDLKLTESALVLSNTAVPDLPWDLLPVEGPVSSVLEALDHHLSADVEQLLFLRLDAPFLSVPLTEQLIELQRNSWSDYTFADGYPIGFAPEILRRELLPVLVRLASQPELPWAPGFLFETITRDINAFDVETEAAPEDYALVRASLTCDTRQNFIFCKRIQERGTRPEEILHSLREFPLLRRSLPYYYQIQVTTEVGQRPSYTPFGAPLLNGDDPGCGTHMPVERWEMLLDRIHAATPEATIAIGYGGEPALHPQLATLIAMVERFPTLSLYVETSGLGWNAESITALHSSAVAAIIVELDAISPERYMTLRGEGMDVATAFTRQLAEVLPGKVYAQATRMVDNEWELQEFYRHWNSVPGVTVIIQKYNNWAGLLPDRKVADLSPLQRIPCRHLERDMVVLVDGNVPRCFQDLQKNTLRGNLFENDLETVWNGGNDDYRDHAVGRYPVICETCDEYYTFNG